MQNTTTDRRGAQTYWDMEYRSDDYDQLAKGGKRLDSQRLPPSRAMKLLVFLAEAFEYKASERSSPLADEQAKPSCARVEDAIVAFIQCEPRDEARGDGVRKQAIKYFRWLSRKRGVTRLVLHSFAHLGEERASPEFARHLLAAMGDQLEMHGLQIHHTPFGWSLKWTMSVEGHGYAKTFKSI